MGLSAKMSLKIPCSHGKKHLRRFCRYQNLT